MSTPAKIPTSDRETWENSSERPESLILFQNFLTVRLLLQGHQSHVMLEHNGDITRTDASHHATKMP